MADKRINALANTASSTASDDFIAVDGTTNGTRKLNAFSPSFGGNATVTGTLTVNSTSSFAGTATIAVGNGVAATLGLNQTGVANAYLTQKATSGDLALGNGGGDQLTIAKATGVVSIASTTASTTTSSGALVVGNGTSGGLGVGGAANIGGTLTVSNPVVAQGTTVTGYQFLAKDTGGTAVGAAYALQTSGGTDKWRWGLRGSAGSLTDSLIFSALDGSWVDALTLGKTGNATFAGSITAGALSSSHSITGGDTGSGTSILQIKDGVGTVKVNFKGNGEISVGSTTASTSTSTGALVVNGGVGVAGAIVAGGAITSTASTDSGLLQLNLVNSSTGTSASSLFRFNAGTRTASLQAYNDTHATLAGQLRVSTSNGDIVVIPSGVTAATFTASGTTFAGAISIGNTVNTVSPTNPNRTITMVIGGTTYYLAAKTTND